MAQGTIVTFLATSLLSGAITLSPLTTDPQAIIHAETPHQQELAEWALDRYQAAELQLPPLTIEFPGPNLAGCDGAPGRTYLTEKPTLIRMCWNDQFMLLHELAHVWVSHNLPASKREPFMAMRTDVKSWASSQVGWAQRGSEHAANVIAWGLLETPYPTSRTYPNDPDSLRTAFQFLTGTDPLHDGGPPIQPPDREFFSTERTSPPLESGR